MNIHTEYSIIDHMNLMSKVYNDDEELIRYFENFFRKNKWILERTKKQETLFARRYLAATIRSQTNLSYERIGVLIGGYNHATVVHHMKEHSNHTETKFKPYLDSVQETCKLLSMHRAQYYKIPKLLKVEELKQTA